MILNRHLSTGSARSAFTLIELMVVIGLIMIVMTIGIPRLIYNNETPLGGSLSAVMDACAAARTKAILSGQTTKVVIDSETYSVTVGGASTKPKSDPKLLSKGSQIEAPGRINFGKRRVGRTPSAPLCYTCAEVEVPKPQKPHI